jgi:hypothetical protein
MNAEFLNYLRESASEFPAALLGKHSTENPKGLDKKLFLTVQRNERIFFPLNPSNREIISGGMK